MFLALKKLGDEILDILLPKLCVGCGREGLYICKDCEVFLSEVENTIPGLTSIWEYEGLMEKLIWKIKFEGQYHIIDELVERALARIELNLPEDTYITYVPMYKKKERQRGFNQSHLIAQKLGLVLNQVKHKAFRVLPLLVKIKDNRSQVGLGPKERVENVRGVFRYCSDAVFSSRFTPEGPYASQKIQHPRITNVLLVDDVYTTGATMNECIKVLKKAGVKNVWIFTLARKLRI